MSSFGFRSQLVHPRHAGGIYVVVAAAMLILIGVSTRIIWPISLLGYSVDPETHRLVQVVSGSPAARAGLRVEDLVVTIYNQPVDTYLNSFLFRYLGLPGEVAPFTVQRDGQLIETAMQIPPPSKQLQVTKLAFLILAFVCWVTGYLLGVVRRHDVRSLGPVSWYWLGVSGIYGSLMLALYGAPPLMRIITWLFPTLFLPLGVYIHLLYPPRRPGLYPAYMAALIFGVAWLVFGIVVGGSYLAGWPPARIDKLLWRVVPLEIIGALGIVAWILYRAYKQAIAAHTRRQIRLIASACVFVVLLLVLFFVLPRIVLGRYPIDANWGIVVTGLVPLAYLFGGVTPDLYRLDRVVSRLLLHLLTITLLAAAVALAETSVSAKDYLVLSASIAVSVAMYPTIHGFVRRVFRRDLAITGVLPAVEKAISILTDSFEAPTLVAAVVQGASEQFDRPAIAFYQGDIYGSNTLYLVTQERMSDLPAKLAAGPLAAALVKIRQVIDNKSLYSYTEQIPLSALEQQMVMSSTLALWCPVVHSRGYLLGLLLLGMRGDLDQYRDLDQRNLQYLADAASQAFSKSAALAEASEAEQLMRLMYQRMLKASDIAAHQLAAELHADIINDVAMLNLYDLEQIAQETDNKELRARILTVIHGERTLISQLRGICEQLHPAGLEDPLGLPGAIRKQLKGIEAMWDGHCCFGVHGHQLPLDATVQREVFRVAEEAVKNAVKHAQATTITVNLLYPAVQKEHAVLEVIDDGSSGELIAPREGHLGVYIMREAARTVGGHLTLASTETGGGHVSLTFPAAYCA